MTPRLKRENIEVATEANPEPNRTASSAPSSSAIFLVIDNWLGVLK